MYYTSYLLTLPTTTVTVGLSQIIGAAMNS